MVVTSVEGSDGYGREEDNGTRQEESEEYIRDNVLELKERRGLDEYVNGLVTELDARRLEDGQNEKDKLELAARRDDDLRINRALKELEWMKKETREKEDLVRRRMNFLNIPSSVPFHNGKRSRGEKKSDHQKKSKGNKAEAKVSSPDKNELLLI